MNMHADADISGVPKILEELAAEGLVRSFPGPDGRIRWALASAGEKSQSSKRPGQSHDDIIPPHSSSPADRTTPSLSDLVEACGVAASHPLTERRFWMMSGLLGSLTVDDVAVVIQTVLDFNEADLPTGAERIFRRSSEGEVIEIDFEALQDDDIMRLGGLLALIHDLDRRQMILESAALALLQDPYVDLRPFLDEAS